VSPRLRIYGAIADSYSQRESVLSDGIFWKGRRRFQKRERTAHHYAKQAGKHHELDSGRAELQKCERIAKNPCSVFLVPVDIESEYMPLEVNNAICSIIPEEYSLCSFRAVSVDRLTAVVGTGIDVEPTNAVIWVNFLSKALEYGGWPKVVMALDHRFMKRSYIEIEADIAEEDLALIRREYPTLVRSIDGSKLYCSRLKEDAPQLNTAYEWDSAWWIPGDPLRALKAVFVFFRPKVSEDIENLHRIVAQTS
jgi:hypothetical protein